VESTASGLCVAWRDVLIPAALSAFATLLDVGQVEVIVLDGPESEYAALLDTKDDADEERRSLSKYLRSALVYSTVLRLYAIIVVG
jgi:hypothetical protein